MNAFHYRCAFRCFLLASNCLPRNQNNSVRIRSAIVRSLNLKTQIERKRNCLLGTLPLRTLRVSYCTTIASLPATACTPTPIPVGLRTPPGRGRLCRESRTSAPRRSVSRGPGDGEKLLDPWASWRRGQECAWEIQTEKCMFMLFFSFLSKSFCISFVYFRTMPSKTRFEVFLFKLFACLRNEN